MQFFAFYDDITWWVVKISEIETLPTTFAKLELFFLCDSLAVIREQHYWAAFGHHAAASLSGTWFERKCVWRFSRRAGFSTPFSGTGHYKRGVRDQTTHVMESESNGTCSVTEFSFSLDDRGGWTHDWRKWDEWGWLKVWIWRVTV